MKIELAEEKVAFAGPWIGEFGWEIMTWVPYLRNLSHDYDKMYISTFEGVEALYTGFHCELEFVPHKGQERTDDWMYTAETAQEIRTCTDNHGIKVDITDHIKPIKEYRIGAKGGVEGEYVRYGSPVVKDVGVLFHARGIEKGASKNWPREKWKKLAENFPGARCIGSDADQIVTEFAWTTSDLSLLMDVIASAAVVIGQSSGVMHLALMCGTPIVTWGDCNNFGDTLKNRYMETWNPFGTSVTWVGDTWDPEPEQIMEAIRPTVNIKPTEKVLRAIHNAAQSKKYIVAVAYAEEKEGRVAIMSSCEDVGFPDNLLEQAVKDLGKSINGAISQAKEERTPASWA